MWAVWRVDCLLGASDPLFDAIKFVGVAAVAWHWICRAWCVDEENVIAHGWVDSWHVSCIQMQR